jgi:hypothetical protein
VDTFTRVDVGLDVRRVAVAVDTGTRVAVKAPATKVNVDTRTTVGVGVTPAAVAVSVDTATLVKVKVLLAKVLVDSRTRVGVKVDSKHVDVAVDARTRVDVDLGWFHRTIEFGPRFNVRVSLPTALLDPRARLLEPR